MPHLFKPGQSGNPAGKPKGVKNFTTLIREALLQIGAKDKDGNDVTYEQAMVKVILRKAIQNEDFNTLKLIWNYLDGKPSQTMNLNTADEGEGLTASDKKKLRDLLNGKQELTTDSDAADKQSGDGSGSKWDEGTKKVSDSY